MDIYYVTDIYNWYIYNIYYNRYYVTHLFLRLIWDIYNWYIYIYYVVIPCNPHYFSEMLLSHLFCAVSILSLTGSFVPHGDRWDDDKACIAAAWKKHVAYPRKGQIHRANHQPGDLKVPYFQVCPKKMYFMGCVSWISMQFCVFDRYVITALSMTSQKRPEVDERWVFYKVPPHL